VTVLGTNDVRLFPVPSACSLNPADVVLRNPRAPCAETIFFDASPPDQRPRLQPQQSLLAFVFVPEPTPPVPVVRRRARPAGGGGFPPLLLRQIRIEDPTPPAEEGVRRVVAPSSAKKLTASVESKRAEAPLSAKRLTAPADTKQAKTPSEEKRVTAPHNPRKIPRRG